MYDYDETEYEPLTSEQAAHYLDSIRKVMSDLGCILLALEDAGIVNDAECTDILYNACGDLETKLFKIAFDE